jgi:uncharacterized protein
MESLPQAQSPAPAAAGPVELSERISSIDALRGFALLGILLMNVTAMGLYFGAYNNPAVAGGADGANLAAWAALHVLAEGKMRCLFSLVFGASVILLTSRLENRRNAADIYYRRNLWLLLFGILHAYLLWAGDILYPYALCAFLLYPFRNMRPRGLLIIGGTLLVFTSAAYIGRGFYERDMIGKGRAAAAAEQAGSSLTAEQKQELRDYEQWRMFMQPTAAEIEKDAQEWRGNALSVIKARAKLVGFFHGMPYYHPMNWDIWSMMFIGMALFKLGVLTARRSVRAYLAMAVTGYAIGIPLNSYTAWLIMRSNFDPIVQNFTGSTYDIGRLSIALGHLGVVMLLCKTGVLSWLTRSLAAVGQMAFSNYVFHSVAGSFLFTGYGLAMYGRLQRYELYYFVGAVWIVQMIVSPIWLKYFRFGPLEWAWRSLTYWKKQPMLRREPSEAASVAAA